MERRCGTCRHYKEKDGLTWGDGECRADRSGAIVPMLSPPVRAEDCGTRCEKWAEKGDGTP